MARRIVFRVQRWKRLPLISPRWQQKSSSAFRVAQRTRRAETAMLGGRGIDLAASSLRWRGQFLFSPEDRFCMPRHAGPKREVWTEWGVGGWPYGEPALEAGDYLRVRLSIVHINPYIDSANLWDRGIEGGILTDNTSQHPFWCQRFYDFLG